MDWNADAFFAIGKTHMVCEDYARSGRTSDGLPYAIVCDGCSSSPDTDFGARLLASVAAGQMGPICRGEVPFKDKESKIIHTAGIAAFAAGVPDRALDATLLAAYPGVGELGHTGVRVSMRGDGVIVSRLRKKDGYGLYVVDHLNNAPRYLNYDREPERLRGYLKRYGERGTLRCCGTAVQVGHDLSTRDPETGSMELKKGWIEDREFEGHPPDFFFPAEYFDLVMVLSDGVQTFQRVARTGTSKSLENVPVEQVIEQLLEIKGTKGAFLQRRCHKFLTNFCAENEWQHSDDFSAAAIWMDEPDV